MENKMKCLAIGLQDTGKTSYITAFWAIEKDGNTDHRLTFEMYPSDTSYLDSMATSWLDQTIVQRSQINITDLTFDLIHKESGRKFQISIPDFKGERFKLILQNETIEEVDIWLEQADCLLFFLSPNSERKFNEEYYGVIPQEKHNFEPLAEFTVDAIDEWIQNIELLKYIHETHGKLKIAFCVSKWDTMMSKQIDVEDWIRQEHLFFYNFVKCHFDDVKYFGVSAQGLDYNHRGEMTEEKVSELTDQKRRAFISFGKNRDYDITLPLSWLLEIDV